MLGIIRKLKKRIFGEGMTMRELEELLSQENLFQQLNYREYLDKVWIEDDHVSNEATLRKLDVLASAPRRHEKSDLIRENAVTLMWVFAQRLQSVAEPEKVYEDVKGVDKDVVLPKPIDLSKTILTKKLEYVDQCVKLGLLSSPSHFLSGLDVPEENFFYSTPQNYAARQACKQGVEDEDQRVRARALTRYAEQRAINEPSRNPLKELEEMALKPSTLKTWEAKKLLNEYADFFKTSLADKEQFKKFLKLLKDNKNTDLETDVELIHQRLLNPELAEELNIEFSEETVGKEVDVFNTEIEVKDLIRSQERRPEIKGTFKMFFDEEIVEFSYTTEDTGGPHFIPQKLVLALTKLDKNPLYHTFSFELRNFNNRYYLFLREEEKIFQIKEEQLLKQLEKIFTQLKEFMKENNVESVPRTTATLNDRETVNGVDEYLEILEERN